MTGRAGTSGGCDRATVRAGSGGLGCPALPPRAGPALRLGRHHAQSRRLVRFIPTLQRSALAAQQTAVLVQGADPARATSTIRCCAVSGTNGCSHDWPKVHVTDEALAVECRTRVPYSGVCLPASTAQALWIQRSPSYRTGGLAQLQAMWPCAPACQAGSCSRGPQHPPDDSGPLSGVSPEWRHHRHTPSCG